MEKRQAPEAIQQYLKLVEELRTEEGKGSYPGSPWFALQGMREIDKATIFEMQRDVFSNYVITFAINVQVYMSVMHMKVCSV